MHSHVPVFNHVRYTSTRGYTNVPLIVVFITARPPRPTLTVARHKISPVVASQQSVQLQISATGGVVGRVAVDQLNHRNERYLLLT